MAMSKAVVITVAGLAVAFASWMFLREPGLDDLRRLARDLSSERPLQGTPARDRLTAVAASQATAQGASVRAASMVSRRLQAELTKSTDWRAFALSAMKRPEEGGLMYARYVTSLCGRDMAAIGQWATSMVELAVQTNGTVSTEQLVAKDRFVSLCAAFSKEEVSQLYNEIREREATSGDPLLAARTDVNTAFSAKDPEALRAAARRLLQTDDPLALYTHRALQLLMASNRDSTYWVDGHQ